MKQLKLGIIGMSVGNGHPYSWSAIFNGYNVAKMAESPFPVISKYLGKEKFPEARIKSAMVTHIWTQDLQISKHIANATYIPHIVENIEAMIPEINAVLLARDDAESHLQMAIPFLEAGLPIYIDKPLALTRGDANKLFALQKYPGQIFSCSALRYCREFTLTPQLQLKFKNISHIDAYIQKNWNKYAIHLIEPIINIIGHEKNIENVNVVTTATKKIVNYLFVNGLTVQIKTFDSLNVNPTINLFSEKGMTRLIFKDTFSAFKLALEKFIEGIHKRKEMTQKEFMLRCIEMIEKANEAT